MMRVDIVHWYRAGGQAGSAPLADARSRMPFQSGLTVSGVAAFMPAVLAADWTVLELAAPVLPGLGVSTQKGPSSPTTE